MQVQILINPLLCRACCSSSSTDSYFAIIHMLKKADQTLYLMQMSLNVTRKAAGTLSWKGALNECEWGFIWGCQASGAVDAQILGFLEE